MWNNEWRTWSKWIFEWVWWCDRLIARYQVTRGSIRTSSKRLLSSSWFSKKLVINYDWLFNFRIIRRISCSDDMKRLLQFFWGEDSCSSFGLSKGWLFYMWNYAKSIYAKAYPEQIFYKIWRSSEEINWFYWRNWVARSIYIIRNSSFS